LVVHWPAFLTAKLMLLVGQPSRRQEAARNGSISDDRNNKGAGTVIVVHHLKNSRSQRILWLLEELNTPYRVETYRRDAKTNLAPSELRAVHPLCKSPV
jgi:hypothetical protein